MVVWEQEGKKYDGGGGGIFRLKYIVDLRAYVNMGIILASRVDSESCFTIFARVVCLMGIAFSEIIIAILMRLMSIVNFLKYVNIL